MAKYDDVTCTVYTNYVVCGVAYRWFEEPFTDSKQALNYAMKIFSQKSNLWELDHLVVYDRLSRRNLFQYERFVD